MTTSELAKALNVTRHAVIKWIREGRLNAIRLPGGRYRIPESEVRKIIEGRSG